MAAAVVWELGELAGDQVRSTRVQSGTGETLADVGLGLVGAGVVAAVMAVRERRASGR